MALRDALVAPPELPPLPLHICMMDLNVRGGRPQPVYSADQMHAYARAALDAAWAAAPAPQQANKEP